MDAIKFINEKVRMCDSFAAKGQKCSGCRLNELGGCNLDDLVKESNVEKAVELVEEWSKEHPRQTRQSLFIQQHPKVATYKGVIGIRPCQLEEGYTSPYCLWDEGEFVQCRKEYWLQEVE